MSVSLPGKADRPCAEKVQPEPADLRFRGFGEEQLDGDAAVGIVVRIGRVVVGVGFGIAVIEAIDLKCVAERTGGRDDDLG